jgi:uncharacterized membrane protein YagU involved in acid resistance
MNNKLKATLLGGIVGGIGDLLYAFVVFGPLTVHAPPDRILRSIAAGWIGRANARPGGLDITLLGLASHFLIAIVMAGVFVFASSALPTLRRRPILWGALYGIWLAIAMNYLIVPLTAVETGQFASSFVDASARIQAAVAEIPADAHDSPWLFAGTFFTHTVMVALPIALINARLNPPDQQA